MSQFGNLKRVDLREIWNHEAADFTPWLAENINLLADVLGIDMELVKREAGVGSFSLDILAKDLGTNKNVIIENQLTPTDHDHLGKLITYASFYKATIIVWIASSFRDEHRQALEWLNQRTDGETLCFGIEPEVIQIDDSKPACQFNLIVSPNDWQKGPIPPQSEPSDRVQRYKVFFQALIDEMREKHSFTNARKGQYQSWYSFASGYSGVTYGFSFALNKRARVELYMGTDDRNYNKSLFDSFLDDKDLIETSLGPGLEWERLDDKVASRVAIYRAGSIDDNADVLQDIHAWAVNNLLKFKSTFDERLRNGIESLK